MYILNRAKHVVVLKRCFVRKSGKASTFPLVALTGLLVLCAAANAAAQSVQRQVLVLQSAHRGNLVLDNFTTNFRVELDQRTQQPVNFLQVFVGPTGPVGAPEQALVDFIISNFPDGSKPDLIVAIAGPASVFARKYRSLLFPDTPLLFAAVDQRYLGGAPLKENETAVAVAQDFPRLVDDIRHLLPQTRQVFMVMGAGAFGKFWRQELEEQFARFRDRLAFVWLDDLSLSEILLRSASLPDNSAIFFLTFGTDAAGGAYADQRVLADLRATANAPLFGAHSVYLGLGLVGGSLVAIDDFSRRTADVAARLLTGAPPKSIDVPLQLAGQPMFDWRELQRWGIPEDRLPPGSVVRYRPPSLWSAYRGTVLSAAGMVTVQSLLILGLLHQRRARRRAEIESRAEPDARRRRQSSPDDVGADKLDGP